MVKKKKDELGRHIDLITELGKAYSSLIDMAI